jgi:hypothetical protein
MDKRLYRKFLMWLYTFGENLWWKCAIIAYMST